MKSLSLGPSSTLIIATQTARISASHSDSIFWGLAGEDNSSQTNGSLVLVEHDEANS
jgi:hypothetical protein